MWLWCLLVWACGSGEPLGEIAAVPPAEAVTGHSDGTLSRSSPIRLQLTRDVVAADQVGQPAARSPFTLRPAVDGTAVWTSRREISFVPTTSLPGGAALEVIVDLGVLDEAWEGQRFKFAVDVLRQSFHTELHGLAAADATGATQRLAGTLTTADLAEADAVEATVMAVQSDAKRKVVWTHEGDGRTHTFAVEGLVREETPTELVLTFDGKPLGIDTDSREVVAIPSLGQFSVSSARALTGSDPAVELRFTDPLAPGQDLRGLVQVEGKADLRYDIDGSVVRVTSASGWIGVVKVTVTGVRNAAGRTFPGEHTAEVSFEPLRPEVRFVGEGVVLPTTAGLTLPIEVVNVSAVTVSAIQVYEATVPQFLQVNTLDDDQELHRVGREVWRQRIPIPQGADRQNRWVRAGLDVSALVAQHPGGLVRLELSFDRPDIVWTCPADVASTPVTSRAELPEDALVDNSYWDGWGEYDENDPGSDYELRHDPCASAFYRRWYDRDPRPSRNVLVSNLGLVAKRGQDGDLVVVATDLRSASPQNGAEIEILDFQQQTLATANTGADGIARIAVPRRPFLVIGRADGHTSFLKLDDGSALSVSHFDTSGAPVQDGVKGFFYAERGVWRPGDDIHLTFLVHDETGRLPADHPLQLELRGPTGVVVERRTVTEHTGPFWPLLLRTSADAPTGTWTAVVQLGGRTYAQNLRVETVIPNRLKIDFDPGAAVLRGPDVALAGTLESRWLHGAKAQNLQVSVEVDLAPRPTTFPSFQDYTFDDPTTAFSSERVEMFRGRTDAEGRVRVAAPVHVPSNAPGLLTASFTTRVFEPSGAASVDRFTVPLSPHERYIGLAVPKGDAARDMLLTDVEHQVQIVAVDADGELAGNGRVRLRLYEVGWRWWWEGGEDDLASYAGTTSHVPLKEDTVELAGGKATWGMEIPYPEWGRFLLVAEDESGTHRSGRLMYVDWPGWAGRSQDDQPGGASVLSVTASEEKVEVGQAVTVHVPTPAGGRALVSLETGTRVLKAEWIEPAGATTSYTFTATPGMAPSVYAHVTLLQPHLASANDLPIRMYGVVPIEVVDPSTHLAPHLVTADVFEPEATTTVRVSEELGRAMTYTLAVVDEGLLGLTRFQTPDPWEAFYRREALGVHTWDLFDHVVGAFGGALEEMLAVGGDGSAEEAPPAKANRFPPVVRVLGPFTLAAGATAQHEVTLPPYIGEVRVMVVAASGDGAFGSAGKSVPVRKPLLVLATLPRVLGPSETLALPIAVFALEDKVRRVDVAVEVEGPISLAGDSHRTLTFASPGDQLVTVPLAVQDAVGVARVRVTAEGGGERAEHVIEIDVRHPGSVEHRAVAAVVQPGATGTVPLAYFGVLGTNTAVVELSRVPPLELGRRLDELVRYPHGCLEQTTSGAFPQVYLPKLLDLKPDELAAVQRYVQAGIDRVGEFRTADGGFGYWPGEALHPWGTSYGGHFLLEAERAGWVLPSGLRAGWVKAQRVQAARWVNNGAQSTLDQAYRLYTLALAGEAELGAMNRLKAVRELPLATLWRLAAAYQLAGQPEVARALMTRQPTDVPRYVELSGTFGSDLRDEAMILETLVLVGGDPTEALAVARRLSDALGAEGGLPTQTAAYALVALARFAEVADAQGSIAATVTRSGHSPAPVQVDSSKVLASLPLAEGMDGVVDVTNRGSGPLFVRLLTTGIPMTGTEVPSAKGLDLKVVYRKDDGLVDPRSLPTGTDFHAEVTLRNTSPHRLDEIALTQIVPSGWELHGTAPGPGPGFEYRDVRDDRVMTYFDLAPGESRTFEWTLHASYVGRYRLGPVVAEVMYDPLLQARTAGQWVEVAPAAGQM
jgi:uncharacterized protein YfaS (alpha-2-macroglobulin family)